jgi:hypothetical protein
VTRAALVVDDDNVGDTHGAVGRAGERLEGVGPEPKAQDRCLSRSQT